MSYEAKKAHFDSMLTLYGRNSVYEALLEPSITPMALHLSNSNKLEGIIDKITAQAKVRNTPIKYWDKKALSRISKNAKQDQGVALDIKSTNYIDTSMYLKTKPTFSRIIALDGIHNPQNLGMILRSVAASSIDAVLLPRNNSAKISPLVIKASAGALFKAKIIYCDNLEDTLPHFIDKGFSTYMLSSHAKDELFTLKPDALSIYVLGNEHEGVSDAIAKLCTHQVAIPMHNGIESLNVAITASLIAFCHS